MAKLYFYYSSMNAGKSTILLQSSYNYRERGMETLLLTPEVDERDGNGTIASRIGIHAEARRFSPSEDLLELCQREQAVRGIRCVFVDEGQFLTQDQVHQLSDVADYLAIPVVVYGLRTDFQGNLFEGSTYLLAWADKLSEVKTICHCGKKAIMVLRLDVHGKVVRTGQQIEIGGNDRYVSVCRKHFKSGTATAEQAMIKGAGQA